MSKDRGIDPRVERPAMSRSAYIILASVAAAAWAGGLSADNEAPGAESAWTTRFGTSGDPRAAQLVKIDLTTPWVCVPQFETVAIENAREQHFTWHFDIPRVPALFPVRWISPPGFEVARTWLHVRHSDSNVSEDAPVLGHTEGVVLTADPALRRRGEVRAAR
jgi:hypothetical protein